MSFDKLVVVLHFTPIDYDENRYETLQQLLGERERVKAEIQHSGERVREVWVELEWVLKLKRETLGEV